MREPADGDKFPYIFEEFDETFVIHVALLWRKCFQDGIQHLCVGDRGLYTFSIQLEFTHKTPGTC